MTNIGRATYIGWGGMTLELLDIDSGGLTAVTEAIERTKYGTSIREFSPGYTDPGSVSVTIVTDDDVVTSQLRVMHDLQTVAPLSIVLPTGLQLTANAFIISFGDSIEKMGLYTLKITFKLTGKVSRTTFAGYFIVPPSGTTLFRGCSYTLHLSGSESGGTDPAGANAMFAISPATAGVTIDNDLDLLIIDKNTEATSVTVTATIQPEPPNPVTISQVVYTIAKPDLSAMSINGVQSIKQKKSTEKIYEYTVSVYPVGADSTATWKAEIFNPATKEWHEAKANEDHISIGKDDGKLSTTTAITTGTYQLRITATSKATTSIKAEMPVTMVVTDS